MAPFESAILLCVLATPYATHRLIRHVRPMTTTPGASNFQFSIVDIWVGIPVPFALAWAISGREPFLTSSIVFGVFALMWVHGIYALSLAGVKARKRRVAFLVICMPGLYGCVCLLLIELLITCLFSLTLLLNSNLPGFIGIMITGLLIWFVLVAPFYFIAADVIKWALEPG